MDIFFVGRVANLNPAAQLSFNPRPSEVYIGECFFVGKGLVPFRSAQLSLNPFLLRDERGEEPFIDHFLLSYNIG